MKRSRGSDPDNVQLNAAVYARDRVVETHVRTVGSVTVTVAILITLPYRLHTGEPWPDQKRGISQCTNTANCSPNRSYCHGITPHGKCAA